MIPRFQHVLVPLDFTPKDKAALEVAFEMAVHEPASVTLLHVIETIDTGEATPDPEIESFYAHMKARAATELDFVSQRFKDTDIRVAEKTRLGRRAAEIVRFASDHSVDLIIMSSHPIDRDAPVRSLATISYQVSLLCECPVMLVKTDRPEAGTSD